MGCVTFFRVMFVLINHVTVDGDLIARGWQTSNTNTALVNFSGCEDKLKHPIRTNTFLEKVSVKDSNQKHVDSTL